MKGNMKVLIMFPACTCSCGNQSASTCCARGKDASSAVNSRKSQVDLLTYVQVTTTTT